MRYAEYLPFRDEQGQALDQGIALLFKAPNSFTGEDVLELQDHGGPVILDMLIRRILPGSTASAPPARAGSASAPSSTTNWIWPRPRPSPISSKPPASRPPAAPCTPLRGSSPARFNGWWRASPLRIYVEAAIDFPDEEIDFLSDGKVAGDLYAIIRAGRRARRGQAGRPAARG